MEQERELAAFGGLGVDARVVRGADASIDKCSRSELVVLPSAVLDSCYYQQSFFP